MQISDFIQLIGVLISFVTGMIAIIISVLSLKQNSKMIEESTRPYIGIYGATACIGSPYYYITVKNFGQSSALISSFTYDFDLKKCISTRFERLVNSPHSKEPFQNIENTTMCPGQSFHAVIDLNETLSQTESINFHIIYSSGTHKYEDDICLNLIGNLGNFIEHNTAPDKELKIISETLQDMYIHSL